MCDIVIALPDSTKNNTLCFGKNSDRPAGECQVLYFSEGRRAGSENTIDCSYLKIPDSKGALATLGCRPYWCWGYETGINEAGVVGGNTAIFTRSLHTIEGRSRLGLTGMELLRLGLERGGTAESAVWAITELLEKYGQWGSAVQGTDHEKGSYDNAFLLADTSEAWVLETSGRRWASQRINSGIKTISNEPSIETDITRSSPDLEQYAAESGWPSPAPGGFNFAYVYGDHDHYSRQVSHIRRRRTSNLLESRIQEIDTHLIMNILRDHYENTFLGGPQFNQYLPDFMTVCMHDSPAGFTWGNTATSVVIELDPKRPDRPVIWCAYQPPCTIVYLPIPFSRDIPDIIRRTGTAGLGAIPPKSAPVDEYDSRSLWWRLYRLLEAVRQDPAERYPQLRQEFDPLEDSFKKKVDQLKAKNHTADDYIGEMETLSRECVAELLPRIEILESAWQTGSGDKKGKR
jgi:secernin